MKNACAALQRKSSEDEEPEGSSLVSPRRRRSAAGDARSASAVAADLGKQLATSGYLGEVIVDRLGAIKVRAERRHDGGDRRR
jgi:hypothetical protein